jgi:hypothetical protein
MQAENRYSGLIGKEATIHIFQKLSPTFFNKHIGTNQRATHNCMA